MDKNNVINTFNCDKPNVCFIGDIHGDFISLGGLMKRTTFRDTVYIICGDCGFGFNKKEYYSQVFNKLSRTASRYNCEFYFIRGNHDERSYFDKRLIYRKCFKAIPDYSVIQTPLYNILCIGGAISVDRTYRMALHKENAMKYAMHHGCSLNEAEKLCKKVYWEDEGCYYDEERLSQLKMNGIDIDIVCTHTAPSFVKPLGKGGIEGWLNADPTLEKSLDDERATMDRIYNKLKADGHPVTKWFYGHYHFHNSEYVDAIKFVLLDMTRNGNCDFYDLHTEMSEKEFN